MYASERLKGIDVFVCVAELGSFTRAAEPLSLSSSAVSKGIARLEQRLGIKLFERTTRRLALTAAGVAFYRACKGILAELEAAELALQAEHREVSGHVRIDLPASFGRKQVMPVLLGVLRRYPLLRPHVTFSDRLIDPLLEGVDLLVRIGGPKVWPEHLAFRQLGVQRLTYCATPAYLAAHGVPASAADLARHACIGYAQPGGWVTPWFREGAAPTAMGSATVPAWLALGDGEAELMAVLEGLGIAQLPRWLIAAQLKAGVLAEVLPGLAFDGPPIHLAWQRARATLPRLQVLIEALGSELAEPGLMNSIPG